MKSRKILGLLILSIGAAANLLAGCNNGIGNKDNNLQTIPNQLQIHSNEESHHIGCYDSFNEGCGDSEIHLDGSTNEMHQKFKINPMYGNYMGDNMPMLISFKYTYRDWSMQHYHLGGNFNFNYNITESSLVFTDVDGGYGCLGKSVVKKGETCYMYATAHIKIDNENIKPDRNNFGARYYNLYDDKDSGLGYMTVNMSTVQTVQSIREIMPFESQYYTAVIKESMNQYQIIRLQNISYSESRILTIQPNGIKLRNSEDKTFELLTRSSATNDAIYGTHSQCASPEQAEPSNKQVSALKRGEECLLIYKAAAKSDKAGTVTNILDLKTNATASPNMNPEMNARGYTDPITPEFKLAATYKPDGESKFDDIEWHKSNIVGNYLKVYYGNGIWVAGSFGGLKWSTDGKNWTNSNITDNNYWGTFHYTNGMWVAGSSITTGGNDLKWSIDGETWNSSNITNSNAWNSIYYANGVWVAASFNIGLKWSADGKTWNNSNITTSSWQTVYYANGTWVTGGNANGGMKWSNDGKVWNNSNITNGYWFLVYYANGIWVAGNNNNEGLLWSNDGKIWNNSNITSGDWGKIYYANGKFVVGSSSYRGLLWSNDGKVWNNSNILSGDWYMVYYANGIWIAGSDIKNGIKLSTDGKTWKSSNITNGYWQTFHYANGMWVAGGSGGVGLYYGIEQYSQPSGSLDNFMITH